MRGMILAAGSGRRLQPLTADRAKPSLPVLGVPLVVRAAILLRSAGIREIVINLHRHGRTVRTALQSHLSDPRRSELNDVTFTWSSEDKLLGTGGGIGRVKDWLAEEGAAAVVNADFLSDIDLTAVVASHEKSGAEATLVVVKPSGSFPGELWTDAKARVRTVGEKPKGAKAKGSKGPLEFTGVQVIGADLLAKFPETPCDSIRDVYPPVIENGGLGTFVHEGFWWEFGSLDRFLDGQLALAREKKFSGSGSFFETGDGGVAWMAPGADLAPDAKIRGFAILSAGARVRPGAVLEDTVLLEQAVVASGCRLRRCVVADEAILMGGLEFENVAIASSPLVAPAGLAGSPETIGGRPAPPEDCRLHYDLWVREIPIAERERKAAAAAS